MGAFISLPAPPLDAKSFCITMIDEESMNSLYIKIIEEYLNPDEKYTSSDVLDVESFMSYLRSLNRPAFERVSADSRIVYEAYKVAVPDPAARKAVASKSLRFNNALTINNLELTPYADLTLSKDQFFIFLPSIFLFSMLWEVFSFANLRIQNALVSRSEYEALYRKRSEIPRLEFKEGLTKEKWEREFDIIDTDGSNRLTYHELCLYIAKYVMHPTIYLALIKNPFSFYDMDADPGPYGGGLPCGELRYITPSELVHLLYPADYLRRLPAPLALDATIFIEKTQKTHRHCKTVTAHLLCKEDGPDAGQPIIQFQVEVSSKKPSTDVTLYGRRYFRLLLPDGRVASRGAFSLIPERSLQPHQAHLLLDSVTGKEIGSVDGPDGEATLSWKNDPRVESERFTIPPDMKLKVPPNGVFTIPSDGSVSDGLIQISISYHDHYAAPKFTVLKFKNHCQQGYKKVSAKMTFSLCNIGNILAGETRVLDPPTGELSHSPHIDLNDLPRSLSRGTPISLVGGVKSDPRCLVTATALPKVFTSISSITSRSQTAPTSMAKARAKAAATQQTSVIGAAMQLQFQLIDGETGLDVTLYGRREFTIRHPVSNLRVLVGNMVWMPPPDLLPKARYLLRDAELGQPITLALGRAIISAKQDPRSRAGESVMADVEVEIIDSSLVLPLKRLPNAVLTVAIDFRDALFIEPFTILKLGTLKQATEETLLFTPTFSRCEIGDISANETRVLFPTDGKATHSPYVDLTKLPHKLQGDVHPLADDEQGDDRYLLSAVAVGIPGQGQSETNAKAAIEFTVGLPAFQDQELGLGCLVDPLDFTLYGHRGYVVRHPDGGMRIVMGTLNLLPDKALLPRAKYIIEDSVTKEPITIDRGKVFISTKNDLRVKSGELQLFEVARDITGNSFVLPLDQLPEMSALTVTVTFENYAIKEFTVLKYQHHVLPDDKVVPLNPTFSRCDVGVVTIDDLRILEPPIGLTAHSPHIIRATEGPLILRCDRVAMHDGHIWTTDTRCLAEAIANPTSAATTTTIAAVTTSDAAASRVPMKSSDSSSTTVELVFKIKRDVKELDISLYGRKIYFIVHPLSGARILMAYVTLHPRPHLLPSPRYLIHDAEVQAPITMDSGRVKISLSQIQVGVGGPDKVESLDLEIAESGFSIPIETLPDCIATLSVVYDNYQAVKEFSVILYSSLFRHDPAETVISITPTFSRCDIGCYATGESRILIPPSVLRPFSPHINGQNAPVQLVSEITSLSASTVTPRPAEGISSLQRISMRETRFQVKCKTCPYHQAVQLAAINLSIDLNDGIDELNISLYGPKSIIMSHPQTGLRVLVGQIILLPRVDLQPHTSYRLTNTISAQTVYRHGKALFRAEVGSDGDIMSSPVQTVFETECDSDGIILFPLSDLPDGIVTMQVFDVEDYSDSAIVTVLKFGSYSQETPGKFSIEPTFPWSNLDTLTSSAGTRLHQRRSMTATEYADSCLCGVECWPVILPAVLKLCDSLESPDDPRFTVKATAQRKKPGEKITIELQVCFLDEDDSALSSVPASDCIALNGGGGSGGRSTNSIGVAIAASDGANKQESQYGCGATTSMYGKRTIVMTGPDGEVRGPRPLVKGTLTLLPQLRLHEVGPLIPGEKQEIFADEYALLVLQSMYDSAGNGVARRAGTSDTDGEAAHHPESSVNLHTIQLKGTMWRTDHTADTSCKVILSPIIREVGGITALKYTLYFVDRSCAFDLTSYGERELLIEVMPPFLTSASDEDCAPDYTEVLHGARGCIIFQIAFILTPVLALRPRPCYVIQDYTSLRPLRSSVKGEVVVAPISPMPLTSSNSSSNPKSEAVEGWKVSPLEKLSIPLSGGEFVLPVSTVAGAGYSMLNNGGAKGGAFNKEFLPSEGYTELDAFAAGDIDSSSVAALSGDFACSLTPRLEGFQPLNQAVVVKFRDYTYNEELKLYLVPRASLNEFKVGDYLVTLLWGRRPRDLDLYVDTSLGESVNCSCRANASGTVKLHIDARRGYGPEIVSIRQERNVRYHIYVKNFSQEWPMDCSSEATISVSRFSPPDDPSCDKHAGGGYFFKEIASIRLASGYRTASSSSSSSHPCSDGISTDSTGETIAVTMAGAGVGAGVGVEANSLVVWDGFEMLESGQLRTIDALISEREFLSRNTVAKNPC